MFAFLKLGQVKKTFTFFERERTASIRGDFSPRDVSNSCAQELKENAMQAPHDKRKAYPLHKNSGLRLLPKDT